MSAENKLWIVLLHTMAVVIMILVSPVPSANII